jgi:hypothetical protein
MVNLKSVELNPSLSHATSTPVYATLRTQHPTTAPSMQYQYSTCV